VRNGQREERPFAARFLWEREAIAKRRLLASTY